MKTCNVIEIGTMGYGEACALQQKLVNARKNNAVPDLLLLCQHPHVITLGRNGKTEHLRASHAVLGEAKVEFCQTNRGGDITYHGPGQLVGYPILNLAEIRRDVGWYVRQLEETMIEASAALGVDAGRVPGCTGVWAGIPGQDSNVGANRAKLGAIGVHLSRWITSHGFAYNVSTNLRYFDLIVPCGIAGCLTTSLTDLLGRDVTIGEVVPPMVVAFGKALGLEMRGTTPAEMSGWLSPTPATITAAGE